MKLSDYVAHFISKLGPRHVFAISGGASVHLIDSIAKHPELKYICPNHEQAGAIAADAYSRASESMGVAISTSGPGATNMITGICSAWFDSVPVLYITGQVSTFRMKKDLGVRQLGFQENDTLDMVKPISKYSVLIEDTSRIRYELEKAVYLAHEGRPGPVVVDIPDNISRAEVDVSNLVSFSIPEKINKPVEYLEECLNYLKQAQRPVLIIGWGVHLSGARQEALKIIGQLGIPVLLTWAMKGLIADDHPLFAGTFGTHGTRYGNFTVQNSDLILSVGARLDTHEAGSPLKDFAREARKLIVDIDHAELGKFKALGMDADVLVKSDAKKFFEELSKGVNTIALPEISSWKERICLWKKKFPICPKSYESEEALNPYVFVRELSATCSDNEFIVSDTGSALAWMMQGFPSRKDQKIIHAFNNTPMGYALPGAIGASFALNRRVSCVTGDGSLQMNIQELSTVIYHNLDIKIFLFNNHGYSMICQTQDQWLDSEYAAANEENGLSFPNFVSVAESYGFPTWTISNNSEISEVLSEVYKHKGPAFCNIEIRPDHRVMPQLKFGHALEDPEPLLSRDELIKNMIIPPIFKSEH